MSKRNQTRIKSNRAEVSLNPCQLQGDRGKRTSRLAMVGTLFAIVWGAIYAGITFLGLLGFVIGTFTALIGTLGGVGLVVLVGWFVVNLFSDAMYGSNKDYLVF